MRELFGVKVVVCILTGADVTGICIFQNYQMVLVRCVRIIVCKFYQNMKKDS